MISRLLSICCLPLLLLTGCTLIPLEVNFTANSAMDSRLIQQDAEAFPQIDLLAMNPDIIDYLEAHVPPGRSDREIVERLQTLLFDPGYLNIQYDDLITRTAIETFETRLGNCLSVVSLYIAMARHFGVEASFQTVKMRPRWDMRGELLVLSQHINATGRLGPNSYYVVDFTPDVIVQQLTSSRVSDDYARALYFNNRGVESMIAGDTDQALLYLRNALWIAPELSIGWNSIGTAYARLGNMDFAEYAFKKSFTEDRGNASPINNLVRFYYNQGEYDLSERYSQAIARFNARNPYYHYSLGNVAYGNGDFELARDYYRQAIRRKESEPEFYLALSLTLKELGDEEEADRMFGMARYLLAASEIYLPGRERMRIVDENSILGNIRGGLRISTRGE